MLSVIIESAVQTFGELVETASWCLFTFGCTRISMSITEFSHYAINLPGGASQGFGFMMA